MANQNNRINRKRSPTSVIKNPGQKKHTKLDTADELMQVEQTPADDVVQTESIAAHIFHKNSGANAVAATAPEFVQNPHSGSAVSRIAVNQPSAAMFSAMKTPFQDPMLDHSSDFSDPYANLFADKSTPDASLTDADSGSAAALLLSTHGQRVGPPFGFSAESKILTQAKQRSLSHQDATPFGSDFATTVSAVQPKPAAWPQLTQPLNNLDAKIMTNPNRGQIKQLTPAQAIQSHADYQAAMEAFNKLAAARCADQPYEPGDKDEHNQFLDQDDQTIHVHDFGSDDEADAPPSNRQENVVAFVSHLIRHGSIQHGPGPADLFSLGDFLSLQHSKKISVQAKAKKPKTINGNDLFESLWRDPANQPVHHDQVRAGKHEWLPTTMVKHVLSETSNLSPEHQLHWLAAADILRTATADVMFPPLLKPNAGNADTITKALHISAHSAAVYAARSKPYQGQAKNPDQYANIALAKYSPAYHKHLNALVKAHVANNDLKGFMEALHNVMRHTVWDGSLPDQLKPHADQIKNDLLASGHKDALPYKGAATLAELAKTQAEAHALMMQTAENQMRALDPSVNFSQDPTALATKMREEHAHNVGLNK